MRPSRRARLAAVARWGGTAACVVLLVVWVASAEFGVAVQKGGSACAVGCGELFCFWGNSAGGWRVEWYDPWRRPLNSRMMWSFHYRAALVRVLVIPLWAPTLAFALPAGWLWLRHCRRGFGPGRCLKCGYELVGLADGAGCPECGIGPAS